MTTQKNTVDNVVTEHGVAELQGRTLRDRARALIAVADPRHRESLERSAAEMGLLRRTALSTAGNRTTAQGQVAVNVPGVSAKSSLVLSMNPVSALTFLPSSSMNSSAPNPEERLTRGIGEVLDVVERDGVSEAVDGRRHLHAVLDARQGEDRAS